MKRYLFAALALFAAPAFASTLLEVHLPRGLVLSFDDCSIESHEFGDAPDGSVIAYCATPGQYQRVDGIFAGGFEAGEPAPVGAWDFHAILRNGPGGPGLPAWWGAVGCGALTHEDNGADALFVLACDRVDTGE